MPVAIATQLKTKKVVSTKQFSEENLEIDSAVKALVDEVEEITRLEMQIADKVARKKQILADLKSRITETTAADTKVRFLGTNKVVEFSMKDNNTSIESMATVRKYMGNNLFLECASVSLKDCGKYLTKEQYKEATKTERDGPRKFKLVDRV
jgi:hypothetical protein